MAAARPSRDQFDTHTRRYETEARGLHDVDNQRERKHCHQFPVSAGKRSIFRRRDEFLRSHLGDVLWQQSITGHCYPTNDERHAKQHARIHGHTRQYKSRVARHPEHRQMKNYSNPDNQRTEPKGKGASPICE
jgi:hypothetical protein